MLVVAHSSGNRAGFSATSCLGKLSLMHLPTAAQLAEAEKRRRAAVATPHKVAQATVTLERSIIEAHAQPILSTSRLVSAEQMLLALVNMCMSAVQWSCVLQWQQGGDYIKL